MPYQVYRRLDDGSLVLIAECEYESDAKAVLRNWYSGKVMCYTLLIEDKNPTQ